MSTGGRPQSKAPSVRLCQEHIPQIESRCISTILILEIAQQLGLKLECILSWSWEGQEKLSVPTSGIIPSMQETYNIQQASHFDLQTRDDIQNASPGVSLDGKVPRLSSSGFKRSSFQQIQEPHASTLPIQNVYQFNVRVNNNNSQMQADPRVRRNRPISSTGPKHTSYAGNRNQKRRPQSAKREIISTLKNSAYGGIGSPLTMQKKASKLQSTGYDMSFLRADSNSAHNDNLQQQIKRHFNNQNSGTGFANQTQAGRSIQLISQMKKTYSNQRQNTMSVYIGDKRIKAKIPTMTQHSKEELYEENMKTKQEINLLKDESKRNTTKIAFLEQQLLAKDKMYEEMFRQNFQQHNYPFNQLANAKSVTNQQTSSIPEMTKSASHSGKSASQTQMVNGLKRTIRELRNTITAKESEMEQIRRDMATTNINQLMVELDMTRQECVRLRGMVEQQSYVDIKSDNEVEVEELKRDLTVQYSDQVTPKPTELQDQTNELKKEIELLQMSNHRLQGRVDSSSQQSNVDQAEIRRLHSDLQQMQQRAENAEKALQRELENLANKKDKEKEEALQETKAEFEYQLQQLQEEREDSASNAEAMYSKLKAEMQQLREAKQGDQGSSTQIEEQLKDLQKEKQALEHNLEVMRQATEKESRANLEMKQLIVQVEDESSTAKAEIKELNSKVEDLSKQLQASKDDKEKLKTELMEEIEVREDKRIKQDEKVKEAQASVKALSNQNQNLIEKLKESEEKRKQNQLELSDLRQKLQEAQVPQTRKEKSPLPLRPDNKAQSSSALVNAAVSPQSQQSNRKQSMYGDSSFDRDDFEQDKDEEDDEEPERMKSSQQASSQQKSSQQDLGNGQRSERSREKGRERQVSIKLNDDNFGIQLFGQE